MGNVAAGWADVRNRRAMEVRCLVVCGTGGQWECVARRCAESEGIGSVCCRLPYQEETKDVCAKV